MTRDLNLIYEECTDHAHFYLRADGKTDFYLLDVFDLVKADKKAIEEIKAVLVNLIIRKSKELGKTVEFVGEVTLGIN